MESSTKKMEQIIIIIIAIDCQKYKHWVCMGVEHGIIYILLWHGAVNLQVLHNDRGSVWIYSQLYLYGICTMQYVRLTTINALNLNQKIHPSIFLFHIHIIIEYCLYSYDGCRLHINVKIIIYTLKWTYSQYKLFATIITQYGQCPLDTLIIITRSVYIRRLSK